MLTLDKFRAHVYRDKLTLLWALARNELRVCARMSRTKFVLVLFWLICVVYFVLVTNWHMQNSGVVPMYGVISPRYIASLLGSDLLALLCLGMLLFTFDIRHRDESNRIREIIDSKPINSTELFIGRLLGIFLLVGTPMFIIVALAVGWGVISEVFSIPFGEPIEPWSVASFLILDVTPSFIFWGSFTLFLVSAIRSRILVLVLTVFCLYGMVWVNSRLPLHISTPLQTVTANVIFPSDLIPTFFTLETFLNRIALILFGFGFLYWLSHIYPRNSPSSTPQHSRALYCFAGGLFLILGMFGAQALEHQQIAKWIRVHDAHFDPDLFPDVKHIEGSVDVYPGRSVSLDLSLSVSVSDHDTDEDVLFSFNPGYRIVSLFIDGDVIKDRSFRNGLLKIPRHYFDSKEVNLRLQAKGRPKTQFAYLDSVDRLSKIIGPEVRQLQYLGTENYIFRPEFVVLMPCVKWYPVAGTATKEDQWEQRTKDFFTVDLRVSVPHNWIVAGPAQRKLLPEEKRTTYLFQTSNPIPQLALVASRFEHASSMIDGIEFEVVYSRQHRKTFETLIPTGEDYLVRIREYLDKLDSLNLTYPHSVFSLVEVPASLRSIGGSKELDPVLGMPGILMVPETTLPTMHVASLHPPYDFQRQRGPRPYTYDEWMSRKVRYLEGYFGIELYAGNHLSHFSRSIAADQLNAVGANAELLNRILNQIMQLYVAEYEVAFDFKLALELDLVDLTEFDPIEGLRAFKRVFDTDRDEQLHELRYARMHKVKSDAVLDAVETLQLSDHASLNDLSIKEERALRVRSLALSKALIDTLGKKSLSGIIAELLTRFRGQNFSYDDFLVAVQSQGVNFEEHFYDMLHSTRLPGFLVSEVTQSRVQTDEGEQAIYQVSFILENGEPVSGFCNVKPVNNDFYLDFPHEAPPNPVFVEKHQRLEVLIESESPVTDILVEPYLSLNRTSIVTSVPPPKDISDDTPDSGEHPRIVSILPTEKLRTTNDLSIVIDDLDFGFSVIDSSERRPLVGTLQNLLKRFSGIKEVPLLRGLPEFQFNSDVVPEDTWERMSHRDAYGKYWRTLVLNRLGRGKSYAKFATQLPSNGAWRLEYFVPQDWLMLTHHYWRSSHKYYSGWDKGVAKIDVHANSDVITNEIDFSGVELGWYEIGQYDIEKPDVEVRLSNPDYSGAVFADAIRWSPVEDED